MSREFSPHQQVAIGILKSTPVQSDPREAVRRIEVTLGLNATEAKQLIAELTAISRVRQLAATSR